MRQFENLKIWKSVSNFQIFKLSHRLPGYFQIFKFSNYFIDCLEIFKFSNFQIVFVVWLVIFGRTKNKLQNQLLLNSPFCDSYRAHPDSDPFRKENVRMQVSKASCSAFRQNLLVFWFFGFLVFWFLDLHKPKQQKKQKNKKPKNQQVLTKCRKLSFRVHQNLLVFWFFGFLVFWFCGLWRSTRCMWQDCHQHFSTRSMWQDCHEHFAGF